MTDIEHTQSKSSSGLPKNATQHTRVTRITRDVPSPTLLHPRDGKPTIKDAHSKEGKEKGRGTTLNVIIPVHSPMTRPAPRSAVHREGLEDQNVQIPAVALLGCDSRHIFTVI